MRNLLLALVIVTHVSQATAADLLRIHVAQDGHTFVDASKERFTPWGVNYDHDVDGRLLDEYWIEDWPTVVEDFQEIKTLGANCVRVHLQLGKFLDSAERPNQAALRQLGKLVALAETTGLYLDITGLACYHKKNIPDWYDALAEAERWDAQAVFWQAVAGVCRDSPAIFCYDLMNEPAIGGAKGKREWLVGSGMGDKFFVQRIALDLGDRKRETVAADWVRKLTAAIREVDSRHMITVGVIPWAHVWPNAKPIFYSPPIAKHLDFVSVHFYPESDKLDKALAALKVYDIGKPIVIEEMFPLKCSTEELLQFVRRSRGTAQGWISFYWGQPAEEYGQSTLQGKIVADWLNAFSRAAQKHTGG